MSWKSVLALLLLSGVAVADTGFKPPTLTVTNQSGTIRRRPIQEIKFSSYTVLSVSGNTATVGITGFSDVASSTLTFATHTELSGAVTPYAHLSGDIFTGGVNFTSTTTSGAAVFGSSVAVAVYYATNPVTAPQFVEIGGGNLHVWNTSVMGYEMNIGNASSDPGGDEANGTTGWLPVTSVMVSTDSVGTDPHTGTYSIAVVGNGGAARAEFRPAASVGDVLEISMWAKKGALNTNDPGFQSWVGLGTFTSIPITSTSSWVNFYGIVKVSAATPIIRIYCGATLGDTVYIDNVSVKQVRGGDVQAKGWFSGGGTAGVHVEPNNNVGINTSSPSFSLDVSGTAEADVLLSSQTALMAQDRNGLILVNAASATGTSASIRFVPSTLPTARYSEIKAMQSTEGANWLDMVFSNSRSAAPAENLRITANGKMLQPAGYTFGISLATPTAPTVRISTGAGGLMPAGTYYYAVSAGDANTGYTLPSAATSTGIFTMNGSSGSVWMTWPQVQGAASYKVYRSTTSGLFSTPALLATLTTGNTTWNDTVVTPGAGVPNTAPAGHATLMNSTGLSWFGGTGLMLSSYLTSGSNGMLQLFPKVNHASTAITLNTQHTFMASSAGAKYGLYSRAIVGSSATLTNGFSDIYIDDPTMGGGGALDKHYGLHVVAQTKATNNFPIYFAGSGYQNGISWQDDVHLWRSASKALTVDSVVRSSGAAGSSAGFATVVTSEAVNRWNLNVDGTMSWGDGAATRDTTLYRSAANTLKTDDSLVVADDLTVAGGGITLSADTDITVSGGASGFRFVNGTDIITNLPNTALPLSMTKTDLSTAAGAYGVNFGQANSTKNSAVLRYIHNGAASANSYLGLGFYGADDLLKVKTGGDVVVGADLYTTAWTDHFAASTVVGWSAYTISQIRYKKIGKLVFVAYQLSGTSNSTTTNFSLPYTNNSGFTVTNAQSYTEDNSVPEAVGIAYIPNGSATVTLRRNPGSTPYGGLLGKSAWGQLWYEAQ